MYLATHSSHCFQYLDRFQAAFEPGGCLRRINLARASQRACRRIQYFGQRVHSGPLLFLIALTHLFKRTSQCSCSRYKNQTERFAALNTPSIFQDAKYCAPGGSTATQGVICHSPGRQKISFFTLVCEVNLGRLQHSSESLDFLEVMLKHLHTGVKPNDDQGLEGTPTVEPSSVSWEGHPANLATLLLEH